MAVVDPGTEQVWEALRASVSGRATGGSAGDSSLRTRPARYFQRRAATGLETEKAIQDKRAGANYSGMAQRLGYVALVVRDYDEAIAFYTRSLGFQLIEDTDLGERKTLGASAAFGLRAERTCCSLEQSIPNRQAASATRPAAESFYFFTPTISGAIIEDYVTEA